tara:strand:- start:1031 stop:1312 length:282 start_codon:yes stop_codon:yes gene_type:complete
MTLTKQDKILIHLAIFELGTMLIKLGVRLERENLLSNNEDNNIKRNLAEIQFLISNVMQSDKAEIAEAMKIHANAIDADIPFVEILREQIAMS